jgi:hypothetical protein
VKWKIVKLWNKQKEPMKPEDSLKNLDLDMDLNYSRDKIQRVIILLLIRRNKN